MAAEGDLTDLNVALPVVLKNSLRHQGLARGLKESVKMLDRRQAMLCCLSKNCDQPMIGKLVEALCAQHGIPLLKVDNNKQLGEWAGLCKIDKEGKPRKVVACSCVVVKDFGEQSEALSRLEKHFNMSFSTDHVMTDA